MGEEKGGRRGGVFINRGRTTTKRKKRGGCVGVWEGGEGGKEERRRIGAWGVL